MIKSVSLIVSFYNRIDFLRLIFAALEQQSYHDFEVIIADDGSRAEIVQELKLLIKNASFQVKHLWHEDEGWRKNTILNNAIVASEANYIIFLDGDCIPHPLFIEEHLNSRVPNQTICGRRVTLTKKITTKMDASKIQNKYFHSALFIRLLLSFFGKEKTRVRHMLRIKNKIIRRLLIKDKNTGILGCNFSLWKEDLLKVNGFDERFIYPGMGEDSDLENRLRQNGVKLVSKKYLVTVYHMYHNPLEPYNEINYQLYDENLNDKVIYTPFGLNKTTDLH